MGAERYMSTNLSGVGQQIDAREASYLARSDEADMTLWRCQACPTIIPARYGHRPVTVDQHEKRHEEETT